MLKKWVTELTAIDSRTGTLTLFAGMEVFSPTRELAEKYCEEHFPYLRVLGECVMEGLVEDIESVTVFDYDKTRSN